jgi:hypothetical protein
METLDEVGFVALRQTQPAFSGLRALEEIASSSLHR